MVCALYVRRVCIAVNEHIERLFDFTANPVVSDIELGPGLAVEKVLLLINSIFDFHLVADNKVSPQLVEDNFFVLIVIEFLEFNVRELVNVGVDGLDGALDKRNIDALPLSESVDDNGIAVKLIVLSPLRVPAFLEFEISLFIRIKLSF